jgi:hypothetical protein
MKFGIRKNEESGGTSGKPEPRSSPDSTVASYGSKFGFSSSRLKDGGKVDNDKSAIPPGGESITNATAAPSKDGKVDKPTTATPGKGGNNIHAAQRSKGDAFLQEADATLKRSTWLSSSARKKHASAAESLARAADAYKAGGCNDEAGRAYRRAASLHKDKLKNLTEASKCLSDAGECLKKSNPTGSTACYRSAVSLLCDAGNLNQQAKGKGGGGKKKKTTTTTTTTTTKKKKKADTRKPSEVGGGGSKKKAGLMGSFAKK